MLMKKWYVWLALIFLPLLAWSLVDEGTATAPHPRDCQLSTYVDYDPAPVFTHWQWISSKEWTRPIPPAMVIFCSGQMAINVLRQMKRRC